MAQNGLLNVRAGLEGCYSCDISINIDIFHGSISISIDIQYYILIDIQYSILIDIDFNIDIDRS